MTARNKSGDGSNSLVDPVWEVLDPTPDIHQMFERFNKTYFWDKLGSVEVKWSPRMTLCAGLCRFQGRNGQCSIHLSKPLLSLRPRGDLIQTLLHEMIHAYLFVADRNRERDAHGPKFVSHMKRINQAAGTKITVYHSFHDEVDFYKTHWWKCNGPCQYRKPYFGLVKRSMNRAPGSNDIWHADHKKTCGGEFVKIKEPSKGEDNLKKKKPISRGKGAKSGKTSLRKISDIFPTENGVSSKEGTTSDVPVPAATPNTGIFSSKTPVIVQPPKMTRSGVLLFTGQGHTLGGSELPTKPPQKKSKGNSSHKDHPLLSLWEKSYKKPSNDEIPNCFNTPKSTAPSTTVSSTSTDSLSRDKEEDLRHKKAIPDRSYCDVIDLSGDEESENRCPACGIEPDHMTVEEHLVFCPMLEDDFEADVDAESNNAQSENDTAVVNCPVCNAGFPNGEINSHLDDCLSLESFKATKQRNS